MVQDSKQHTFHIPVMGLGFSIDTPIKVARYGINSVVSIIQDALAEQMREFYCKKEGVKFAPIPKTDIAYRSKRITAYLNLMQSILNRQIEKLKVEPFEKGKDIITYFELLPEYHSLKKRYQEMTKAIGEVKETLQKKLRDSIKLGSIDVNIMTKVDKLNYDGNNKELPLEYSDALAALKGFGDSLLDSSIVFSAGLNPRLYAYLETFSDFFPDEKGNIKKKIILKVSDYRSALIQGKYLAKKGLWVSEFRIESGLNCGGHAFPTQGYLLGPILEEFKTKKEELVSELSTICNQALITKGKATLVNTTNINITAQGGIGTKEEDTFLRTHYNLNGTGWGSPFLLVPEATNVDDKTLKQLTHAKKEDYYLSYASPLGIPFSNFRKTTAEDQRQNRINKNRAGSPCYLKHLITNTEFSTKQICLASREYQYQKLKELDALNLDADAYNKKYNNITEKDCLCEGLSSSALLKYNLPVPHKLDAVNVCPSQNLAYFSSIFSLKEMVGHIYGRINILNSRERSHMFINELNIYFDFMKDEVQKSWDSISEKRVQYFDTFKENLLEGIAYYKDLIPNIKNETEEFKANMQIEMENIKRLITTFSLPKQVVVCA